MRPSILLIGITKAALAAAASIKARDDIPGTYGGFAGICIWPGNVLTGDKYGIYQAACPPYNDLNWKVSELNLNHCFYNNNGKLIWQKEGNAMKTCKNCARAAYNSHEMTCQCLNSDFAYIETTIDLEDGIGLSQNNSLTCYGIEDDVTHNRNPDKTNNK